MILVENKIKKLLQSQQINRDFEKNVGKKLFYNFLDWNTYHLLEFEFVLFHMSFRKLS